MNGRRLVLTSAAAILAAAATTGIAHATPAEDRAYLSALDDYGIVYSSVPDAITAGHLVCDSLDAGWTIAEIGEAAMNAGADPYVATAVIGSAIDSYCHEYSYLFETRGGKAKQII